MVLNSSPAHRRGNSSDFPPSRRHDNSGSSSLEPEVVVVTNMDGWSSQLSGSRERKLRGGCRVTSVELLSYASQIAAGMVCK